MKPKLALALTASSLVGVALIIVAMLPTVASGIRAMALAGLVLQVGATLLILQRRSGR